MQSIAVYGKGGGGKSTIASNLSVHFARRKLRTLQIGCDPKHDSTRSLVAGKRVTTVVEAIGAKGSGDSLPREDFLIEGMDGIGCIEAGGPESGVGCAGLGIVATFRVIKQANLLDDYDLVVMDVLGDVVCGGFAMPLTRGLAGNTIIVVSDTPMSMYAANNICKAVRRYSRNGVRLLGLVANGIREEGRGRVDRLAEKLGTRVLAEVPYDPRIVLAERRRTPISVMEPDGSTSEVFERLCGDILSACNDSIPDPTPMSDDECDAFFDEEPP